MGLNAGLAHAEPQLPRSSEMEAFAIITPSTLICRNTKSCCLKLVNQLSVKPQNVGDFGFVFIILAGTSSLSPLASALFPLQGSWLLKMTSHSLFISGLLARQLTLRKPSAQHWSRPKTDGLDSVQATLDFCIVLLLGLT